VPGNRDFQEFYEASYGRIVALVAAMLLDRHEAEDIAQEAFARALARWSRIAGYDLPEAWVRRVAIRLAADAGRRLRRAARVSERLASVRRGNDPAPADALALTPLGCALRRVPLRQREVPSDHSGMYLLDTAGPAGDFTSARLLVSYFAQFGQFSQLSPDDEGGVVITPGGSAVFAAMSTSQGMGRQQALVEFSARTGAPLRLVTPVDTALELSGNYCGALWTDPSGRRLVADCGALGKVDDGRFTGLFSSIAQPGFLFAW